METNKTLEVLSKALIGVGLGYLTYMIATMPKEMQSDIGKLADIGDTDKIKMLTDNHQEKPHDEHDTQQQPKEHRFIPHEKPSEVCPNE